MSTTKRDDQPATDGGSIVDKLGSFVAGLEDRFVDDSPSGLLEIYLSDHRAGAAAARALAERCADSNRESALGQYLQDDFLPELAKEIEELEAFCRRKGFSTSTTKQLAARAGELAGRLKLNGRIWGYSPLSRILELEGLIVGVTGKQQLWSVLAELDAGGPFAELAQQAQRQREQLEHFHRSSLHEAFAVGAQTT